MGKDHLPKRRRLLTDSLGPGALTTGLLLLAVSCAGRAAEILDLVDLAVSSGWRVEVICTPHAELFMNRLAKDIKERTGRVAQCRDFCTCYIQLDQ